MPTPPNTRPADLLESAALAHQEAGYDFPAMFDGYFAHHYVVKTPVSFLMARADPFRDDAWFVWWAEARQSTGLTAIQNFLRCIPEFRPYVGWSRGLRGKRPVRYYSTARLLRLTSGRTGP